MKKLWISFITIIMALSIAGCGGSKADGDSNSSNADQDSANEANATETAESQEEDDDESDANEKVSSTTLPAGFPADFPFPNSAKIFEVEDDSDEDRESYIVRFEFAPDIDLESLTEELGTWSEKNGFDPFITGEDVFKAEIYQYQALINMSTNDMFVVTIKPDMLNSGDVRFKRSR